MQKKFNEELFNIKEKYNAATKLVSEASQNLGGLFKAKMLKVKNRITEMMAKTDIKV